MYLPMRGISKRNQIRIGGSRVDSVALKSVENPASELAVRRVVSSKIVGYSCEQVINRSGFK